MTLFEKIKLILHVLRWRLTWGKRNLDYLPGAATSRKFITARAAAGKIRDGACVASAGMAGIDLK